MALGELCIYQYESICFTLFHVLRNFFISYVKFYLIAHLSLKMEHFESSFSIIQNIVRQKQKQHLNRNLCRSIFPRKKKTSENPTVECVALTVNSCINGNSNTSASITLYAADNEMILLSMCVHAHHVKTQHIQPTAICKHVQNSFIYAKHFICSTFSD